MVQILQKVERSNRAFRAQNERRKRAASVAAGGLSKRERSESASWNNRRTLAKMQAENCFPLDAPWPLFHRHNQAMADITYTRYNPCTHN
jgi:hypothetical protein